MTLNFILGWHIIYSLIVLFITGLFLLWAMRKLRVTKDVRLDSVKHMDVSEAVETDASDEDIESITKRRAISSIEARFDIIRRVFVPGILLIAAFLIFIPLLPKVSASYVTMLVGIITVLVGIAAKPVIENAVSGVVLTLSQPIKANDTVIIDGHYGTIEKITLLYTVLKVWNFRRFIIPNHKLMQKEYENLSQTDEVEWAHVEFYVAPNSDLEVVKSIAKKSMQCKYLANSEAPSFWVLELKPDSIVCWVAGWANNPAEAWALKSTTRRRLASSLTKAGIKSQMTSNHVEYSKVPANKGKL